MNTRNVITMPLPPLVGEKLTTDLIGSLMSARWFNGRNGTSTLISREELAELLAGAAELALAHVPR